MVSKSMKDVCWLQMLQHHHISFLYFHSQNTIKFIKRVPKSYFFEELTLHQYSQLGVYGVHLYLCQTFVNWQREEKNIYPSARKK